MKHSFRTSGFSLIELMIVVLIIAVVLAIALSNYFKMGQTSKKAVCVSNLKKIDAAIDQWTLDNTIRPGTQPSAPQEDEIYSYVKGGKPICPGGGKYTIYAVGSDPQVRCSKEDDGHVLSE